MNVYGACVRNGMSVATSWQTWKSQMAPRNPRCPTSEGSFLCGVWRMAGETKRHEVWLMTCWLGGTSGDASLARSAHWATFWQYLCPRPGCLHLARSEQSIHSSVHPRVLRRIRSRVSFGYRLSGSEPGQFGSIVALAHSLAHCSTHRQSTFKCTP
jgi:hypothetical protein